MSLQDPVLRAKVLEFRWSPAPLYSDFRGSLAQELRRVTGEPELWNVGGGPFVVAWSDERALNVFVSETDLLIATERLDQADALSVAADALPAVVSTLEIESLVEVEVALTWLLAAETRVDAATALERHVGASDLRDVLSPFGGRPDDTVLQYWFGEGDGTQTTLRLSSVTSDELRSNSEFLTEFAAGELPPAAVLVHLRRRHRAEIQVDSAIELATHQVVQATSGGERLVARLYRS